MTPTQHRIMCLLIERAYPMTGSEVGAALGISAQGAKWQLTRLRRQKLAGPTRPAGRAAKWVTYAESERLLAEFAVARLMPKPVASVEDDSRDTWPRQAWTTAWQGGEGRRQTWHP